MSGIYIHVPFCVQRCHYCDFYTTIRLGELSDYSSRLLQEINDTRSFLSDRKVDTIYFGGGTPSLMDIASIERIIDGIKNNYDVSEDAEITLEANPDDLSLEYIRNIAGSRVNRLSIGIQSFDEGDLETLNRRHNARQARECVHNAHKEGFRKISIDLIYGLPDQGPEEWERNLEIAAGLPIDHISAYNLTYEKGTNFYKWMKEGRMSEPSDELSLKLFSSAVEILEKEGFEHYEISNFAKGGNYSRHNIKYWFGEEYLGLGPSAHSYNGKIRQWNISDLTRWINNAPGDNNLISTELIDKMTWRNEVIMTRLRTRWGIPEKEFVKSFGKAAWDQLLLMSSRFIESGMLVYGNGHLSLSSKGKFLADGIISDLFIV